MVEYEQNDQAIKKMYGTRLELKLQQAQLGIINPNKLRGKMRRQSLQAINRIKRKVIANQDNQTYAAFQTDYDEFEPRSRVDPDGRLRIANKKKLGMLRELSADDFGEATEMEGITKRKNLYSTIVR